MNNTAIKVSTAHDSATDDSSTARNESQSAVNVEEQPIALSEKRMAQHAHWMRVMMEGQSTPDLRYQRSKIEADD